MFEVTVSGWFAAAHQLRFSDGRTEPLHGHNWHVKVTYEGESLDDADLLVDFTRVKPLLDALLLKLHDRNLNDLAPFDAVNPSAERVAAHIAAEMSRGINGGVRMHCVEVEEAPGCIARFFP